MPNKILADAWTKAASELGFEIEPRHIVKFPDGSTQKCLLLKNYGSKRGTIILDLDEIEHYSDMDKFTELGYYCSALAPEAYADKETADFQSVLDDWGWFGN